jgi:hypothetical protein
MASLRGQMIAPNSAPEIDGTVNGFATVLVKIEKLRTKYLMKNQRDAVRGNPANPVKYFRFHCIRRRSGHRLVPAVVAASERIPPSQKQRQSASQSRGRGQWWVMRYRIPGESGILGNEESITYRLKWC